MKVKNKKKLSKLFSAVLCLQLILSCWGGMAYAAEAPADNPKSAVSTDLADFLTNVEIDAETDADGNYIINPNSTYEMTFTFAENESLQFDDEEVLTYDLPEGLRAADVSPNSFSINVVDAQGTDTVSGNTFEVIDGQLRVRLNKDDPNFERLAAMANVRFNITIASAFDQTAGEISFNPSIVKDFVYEENADLNITKNVSYDSDSDTASYTLQITSAGTNENVVLEDHLTGTALIFNKDVSIESSVSGTVSAEPDYNAVDNGFRVTIPQMSDGEVLTLHYTASVDNTKITGNGTVAQTNNTARVTSDQVPDGKEVSANFAGQAKFSRVEKSAAGDPVPAGENLYEQTWTIKVNEDHKMPMGGTYISDWVGQNSRPFMLFTGDGISVQVTLENGSVETRTVPWSELRLYTNDDGTYGWAYLTPESDGKASYEITCTTLINSTGALGNLTLVNGAQVYQAYDEGTTTVTGIGESTFALDKKAIDTTSEESEWQLTLTVPGEGLQSPRIVDDMPRLQYNGQDYIDYLVDGSMTVEGLLDGETWTLGFDNDNRTFVITFYNSEDQSSANRGLLPTPDGQPRDIVIRYKTAVNQDWLDLAANDGYNTSSLYTHKNTASARAGDYRLPSVSDVVYPVKPVFEKSFVERTDAEIDGVTYPVFHYSLLMTRPVADGVVIHDSFDTQYLKYYEEDGVKVSAGMSQSTSDTEEGTASVTDTADGIDITVNDFLKQPNGKFFRFYRIQYSLIVKDAAALEELNTNAAQSQNGITLENTAAWDDMTSKAQFTYSYFPYVDKELLARPTADNGYVAEFKVFINKYAEDLDPTSDVLTIRDVLSSNLRLLPDSIVISPENDAITVQHDSETNTLTFDEVPDETAFEITYQARVLGNGNVTYSNTIQFGKFEKTIEENTTVESSGTGSASNPSITLVKRDAENISAMLSGAVFQLYYMDGEDRVPVRDRNGENVMFTSGADGKVLLSGSQANLGWTLWEGRTYCLVERTAPAGYEISEEPVYFILSENPSSQMEYDLTGEQLYVGDTPVKTSVPVVKKWIGPAAGEVEVHLLADGEDTGRTLTLSEENNWSGTFEDLRKYNESGEEIKYTVQEVAVEGYDSAIEYAEDGSCTITNTNTETISIPVTKTWVGEPLDAVAVNLYADGEAIDTVELSEANNWTATFENLPKYDRTDGHEIAYDAQEEPVSGYVSERSGTVETGFTFTNTISGKTSVPVTKVWIGPAAEKVTVHLLADGEEADSVDLSADNNWQHTFADLEKYRDGKEIKYTVQEVEVEGYDSAIEYAEDGSCTITNTNTETISIPVTKTWDDNDNQDGARPESITIRLLANGTEIANKTVGEADNWSWNFADLPKYEGGKEITYSVTEDAVSDYTTTYNGYDVINTHTPGKTSISVTKAWDDNEDQDGIRPNSITVKLLADGEDIGKTEELNEANNWTATFGDLDESKAGKKVAYTVEEIETSGYTTTVTGDATTGYTITNTHTPEVTEINGTKTWDDNDNQDGARPENITIRLLANGTEVANKTVGEADDWSWSFDDLPKYEGGKEITYSVTEDAVSDYTTTYNGFDVINTHTPGKTSISVTKEWDDNDDQDGIRPNSITVKLLADGEDTGKTEELNEANNWTASFGELDEYQKGSKVAYTVEEVEVKGYTASVAGDAETGYKITNTHAPEKTAISVTKVWDDQDNKDGNRPKEITIRLIADGKDTGKTLILNEANKWSGLFADLDLNKDGKKVEYSISEDAVNGYKAAISGSMEKGFVVTNTKTIVPPKTPTTENPTPQKTTGTPKTGDESRAFLYLVMILIAGGLATCLILQLKRRKEY